MIIIVVTSPINKDWVINIIVTAVSGYVCTEKLEAAVFIHGISWKNYLSVSVLRDNQLKILMVVGTIMHTQELWSAQMSSLTRPGCCVRRFARNRVEPLAKIIILALPLSAGEVKIRQRNSLNSSATSGRSFAPILTSLACVIIRPTIKICSLISGSTDTLGEFFQRILRRNTTASLRIQKYPLTAVKKRHIIQFSVIGLLPATIKTSLCVPLATYLTLTGGHRLLPGHYFTKTTKLSFED